MFAAVMNLEDPGVFHYGDITIVIIRIDSVLRLLCKIQY